MGANQTLDVLARGRGNVPAVRTFISERVRGGTPESRTTRSTRLALVFGLTGQPLVEARLVGAHLRRPDHDLKNVKKFEKLVSPTFK
jgi:hypothetical protein